MKKPVHSGKPVRIALLIMLMLLWAQVARADDSTGTNPVRRQAPVLTPEPVSRLSEVEKARALQAGASTLSQLMAEFKERIDRHLRYAGAYDVDSFAKNDDELNSLLEKIDATYLDTESVSEQAKTPLAQLAQAREEIRRARLLMYKSSCVFYLCFGRPLQSVQCARLGLNMTEPSAELKDYAADLLFYLGAASCWSGEYKQAEDELKRALSAGEAKPYTQVAPGQTVNLTGQNPYTPYYLSTVYIAEKENARAIELLNSLRQTAVSDELRGSADALLALAHKLDKRTALAAKHSQLARAELENQQGQMFPSIAKELLGIACAVNGDYGEAEQCLTEALPGLQASPVKLGNRLEAAQASLWRAYCRECLGKKDAAAEDRRYAMNFAGEAPHLNTVAGMLDALFARHYAGQSVEPVKNKWAVVVGLSNFADPYVPRLRYSSKDAQDMTSFLTQQAGFKADHVRTLLDSAATKANLVDCLSGSWLPSVSAPGDLVFLFISSHGTPAYKNLGAMNSVVTYDTRIDHLFSTSVPMQSLVRIIASKLPKRHAFVILDTCYAGGLGAPGEPARASANVDPDVLVSSSRQLLVSSSDAHERSWESKRYKNSVFTRQLIDTLVQRMKYDDFQSVFGDVKEKVAQEVSLDFKGNTQTPRLSGIWSGKGLISPTSGQANVIEKVR